MKKIIALLLTIVLYNCTDNDINNNCFLGIVLNETVNLSNPQFIDIQVPGGHTVANIGGRNLIIIRRNNSDFKAFDLQCPDGNCTSPMTFDGLKLVCPCNNKEYNSLNGSPIDGEGCFALEYNVIQIGNTALQISR
ncbi:Rieske 2Fe-2S domain-containing protein [uncultured Tenacibaculum sp.]|uniref:Rieske 2Fe-2S domain-containing protein n=1 Tax=uncultured Tenacibaculum sp. TaxID=174713 RepID=UPI00260594EB|nr:Rieske 2Fe-2S domain-containing protein [uncultured Tenacibaculum sp.]